MSKRLIVNGPIELLQTIMAVWAGQGLRFELEDLGTSEQPLEEIEVEKNLVLLTTEMEKSGDLPPVVELNKTADLEIEEAAAHSDTVDEIGNADESEEDSKKTKKQLAAEAKQKKKNASK